MELDPDGNPYRHNEEQNEASKNNFKNITQAPSQLRKEVLALIRRYGQESDLTVYQALGALEICKSDLIKMLDEST